MIRLKNRFGKANRKEMSWMSDLMETLRQEGISPDLLRAVRRKPAAGRRQGHRQKCAG